MGIINIKVSLQYFYFSQCCANSNIAEETKNELATEKKEIRTKIVTEGIDSINQENFGNPRYRGSMNENSSPVKNHQEGCRLSQIEMVAEQAQILSIEIVNSTSEPKGLTIKINPFGLINGLRKSHDGITYFGFEDYEPYEVKYL